MGVLKPGSGATGRMATDPARARADKDHGNDSRQKLTQGTVSSFPRCSGSYCCTPLPATIAPSRLASGDPIQGVLPTLPALEPALHETDPLSFVPAHAGETDGLRSGGSESGQRTGQFGAAAGRGEADPHAFGRLARDGEQRRGDHLHPGDSAARRHLVRPGRER